ncbi:MAG: hypothetical protein IT370_22460 [Deltaproteobacteria bacterium]|nr:hypothetical protein [Deltaproteobacteria bacterium]
MSAPRSAPAELIVIGTGVHRELPPAQFGKAWRGAYDIFVARCTKCHRVARVIDALQLGVTPVTRQKFETTTIPKYVVKMLRKGKSGIAKDEARQIVEFLLAARKLAQRPAAPAPLPTPPQPAAPTPPPTPTPTPSSSPAPAPTANPTPAATPAARDAGAAGAVQGASS